MAFDLQQLRQVVALAEHGSFVRAATALHISQPALSRSIQNLERHFGTELFVRSTGGVIPTDLGRIYIERARDLLRMADDLDREAVTRSALQSGRVAVGGGIYPTESFLGTATARFVERYPRVRVQLRARDWDELVQELRSRELDFFVAESSTLQKEPDLEVMPLPSAHSGYFIARAGHPLSKRESVTTADALAWPFAAPGRIPPRVLDPLLAAHRAATQRGLAPPPMPAVQCHGLAAVKRMLSTSDMISASILSCIEPELEAGRLVVLGTEPWLHLHYGIVSLKGRPWTQAAEHLRDFVIAAEAAMARDEARLVKEYARTPGARQRPPRKGPRRS